MTKKVFWEDPYQTKLKTLIQTVDGNRITVKETIFYAYSGGQESDRGTIAGFPVIEAKKEGKEIFYTLPHDHKLNVGEEVDIEIDWSRRYKLMRLHFAAEVVLEIVCQRFPDVIKVGAHIAEEKSRIDFAWNQNITPFIDSLQEAAQAIINSNQVIISDFSDEKAERRYWKIQEFSQVPCGGTHIKRTSEIGTIHLKRVNPGKGRERIEISVSRTDI